MDVTRLVALILPVTPGYLPPPPRPRWADITIDSPPTPPPTPPPPFALTPPTTERALFRPDTVVPRRSDFPTPTPTDGHFHSYHGHLDVW